MLVFKTPTIIRDGDVTFAYIPEEFKHAPQRYELQKTHMIIYYSNDGTSTFCPYRTHCGDCVMYKYALQPQESCHAIANRILKRYEHLHLKQSKLITDIKEFK